MFKSVDQTVSEIMQHIRDCGGPVSTWYVGIASDPQTRLFNNHQVHENGDAWIFRNTPSHEIARAIEQYFVSRVGTDGGPGGGDVNSIHVYAYKKTRSTNP